MPPGQVSSSSSISSSSNGPAPFTVNLGEEALGGLAAGIVGTVLGFPLDLVKTR